MTTLETQIDPLQGIREMPAEEYHAAPGDSKSSLDDIAPPNTALHYWARHVGKTVKKKVTDAMKMGTLTHTCILEPDLAHDAFHAAPEGMDFRTTAGKAWKAEHADRPILNFEDGRAIIGMRDAVWSHQMASALLLGAETERSLFATDLDGILRKCRLDALNTGNSLPDVKTITSTDLDTVQKSIADRRYHVQAAYYIDLCALLGIEKETFVLICVEKEPPHDVCCYEITPEAIAEGRKAYQADLALLNHCRTNNRWPGRSDEILFAGLPTWKMRKLERE